MKTVTTYKPKIKNPRTAQWSYGIPSDVATSSHIERAGYILEGVMRKSKAFPFHCDGCDEYFPERLRSFYMYDEKKGRIDFQWCDDCLHIANREGLVFFFPTNEPQAIE